MKKIMNLKTMLGALVLLFAFTGCHKDPELQSITLKPTAITLSPNESVRLAVIIEPAELDGKIEVKWTSSDESVATVSDNGTIKAIASGKANITATATTKSGDFKGVCEVTVKDYLETLNFTGAFVYDYDTLYSNKLDTLRSESWGDQFFVAKKVLCDVLVFSEGFYLSDEFEFAGADKGAILEFEAPFYWAPKWANNGVGTIFTLGNWVISNDYTQYPDSSDNVGRPYSIDEANYIKAINTYVQDVFVKGERSQAQPDLIDAARYISGATLKIYEYHSSTEEGYGSDGYYSPFIPDMVIGEGAMKLEDTYTASKIMLGVTAHNFNGKELYKDQDSISHEVYIYGVHFKDNDESIDLLENKIYFGKEYSFVRGVKAAAPKKVAQKSKYKAIPVREISPEIRAHIREQLDRKDVKNKK